MLINGSLLEYYSYIYSIVFNHELECAYISWTGEDNQYYIYIYISYDQKTYKISSLIIKYLTLLRYITSNAIFCFKYFSLFPWGECFALQPFTKFIEWCQVYLFLIKRSY